MREREYGREEIPKLNKERRQTIDWMSFLLPLLFDFDDDDYGMKYYNCLIWFASQML